MKAEDLHTILLVGGSTKGKWVLDTVSKEFGAVGEPYFPTLRGRRRRALRRTAPASSRTERESHALARLPAQERAEAGQHRRHGLPSPGSDLTLETCRGLQVHLEAPDGKLLGPAEVSAQGQFVFRQVGIPEDGSPSAFK